VLNIKQYNTVELLLLLLELQQWMQFRMN